MKTTVLEPTAENIKLCANALKAGEIVAFPTETVYGLGADGYNETAVPKIFEAKGRPQTNPLTLHVSNIAQIEKAAYVGDAARLLIEKFMPGPITVVLKKKPCVPAVTVAGGDTVAVRMPDNKIALALIDACAFPLAAPSANSSGRPSPTCAQHVEEDLAGKVGYILDGGKCTLGIESTIIDMSGETPKILRKGAVSAEDIEKVLGTKMADSSKPDAAKIPAGYVPKITVIYVLDGHCFKDEFKKRNGAKVTGKEKPEYIDAGVFIPAGINDGEYAKNLFDIIRGEEQKNTKVLFCIGCRDEGIGATVNSRLEKLSGGYTL